MHTSHRTYPYPLAHTIRILHEIICFALPLTRFWLIQSVLVLPSHFRTNSLHHANIFRSHLYKHPIHSILFMYSILLIFVFFQLTWSLFIPSFLDSFVPTSNLVLDSPFCSIIHTVPTFNSTIWKIHSQSFDSSTILGPFFFSDVVFRRKAFLRPREVLCLFSILCIHSTY